MHWRYSVSRLTLPGVSICAFMLMLGCTGCSKPPTFHITASIDSPLEDNEQYKIFLQGKQLGTVTGKGTFAFDAQGRRGDTLEDAQPANIEATTPWLCSWVKADTKLFLSGADEIELARKQARPVQAELRVSFQRPEAQLANIFIDNRGGPPAVISVGELQQTVAAGETKEIDMYFSADCEEAKQVRLNGQVIAPANAQKTLLIDVTHSHCYLDAWATYSNWPEDPAFGRGSGKKMYYPRFAQFLDGKPNYFMEPLPMEVRSTNPVESYEALNSVPCAARAH